MKGKGKVILEMQGISKSFPGVKALDNVSLTLKEGEIIGLVGENGAGKSTLVKILAGIYRPVQGRIFINDSEVYLNYPWDASKYGLAFVHQQLNMVPFFDVVDNAYLGRWITKQLGVCDKTTMRKRIEEICKSFNFSLDTTMPIKNLSISDQWMVQIIRAFVKNMQILVMDEPTAALSDEEVQLLFETVQKISKQGTAIIYVSHKLNEIFKLCDRIIVLRDGKKVYEGLKEKISRIELITKIIGEERKESIFPVSEIGKNTIIEVENLSIPNKLKEVTFNLREGEILGVYGLQGSGRTEVAEVLFGIRTQYEGSMTLMGKPFKPCNPADAVSAGVALVPEDRMNQGLILRYSILDNLALPNLLQYVAKFGYFKDQKFRSNAINIMKKLKVNYRKIEDSVELLSGGNQQKVVLSKWLMKNFVLLIFDEPTVGVDVGARRHLYYLIHSLAIKGHGIIVISSDIEEMIEINPNRVMVMREGAISGFLQSEQIDRGRILNLCYGG